MLFHICHLGTQQRYILQEQKVTPKIELSSLVDSLSNFLNAFDLASKYIQSPLPKPKIDIGSTKAKDNLFTHFYKDIIEHSDRQIRLSFLFRNNKSCFYQSKKFNNIKIKTYLQKLSNLTIAKVTTSKEPISRFKQV